MNTSDINEIDQKEIDENATHATQNESQNVCADKIQILDDKKWEVQFINDRKAFGMFATENIKSGTVLLNEGPILTLPRKEFRNGRTDEECIILQFNELSNVQKERILSLHNNFTITDADALEKQNSVEIEIKDEQKTTSDEKLVIEIFRTNAYEFSIECNSNLESGLFVDISRINHSCFPNFQFIENYSSSHLNTRGIVALFDIEIGEEITNSYIGDHYIFTLGLEERLEYIWNIFGFECECNECLMGDSEIEGRENYRNLYSSLEKEIKIFGFSKSNPNIVYNQSLLQLQIMDKYFKSYPTVVSRIYMNIATSALDLKKYELCAKYLQMTVELDMKYYGSVCSLKVEKIKKLTVRLPTVCKPTIISVM